jgi:hypothetical protein
MLAGRPRTKRALHSLLIQPPIHLPEFGIQVTPDMSVTDVLVVCSALLLAAILLPTAPLTRAILYVVLIGLTALPSILIGLDKVFAIFG